MKQFKISNRLIFLIFSIAWAIAITGFSSDNFGIDRTSTVIEPMLKWLFPTITSETIYVIHVLIRKTGHCLEYGLFALFVFGVWAAGRVRWQVNWLIYTLLFSSILAFADEYRQSFTRTRQGSIHDSFVDIAGAAIALLLIWLLKQERFSTQSQSTLENA